MPKPASPKLKEIAKEIQGYLDRFETDPAINVAKGNNLKPYFMPRAFANGTHLGISYRSFQGYGNLTKAEAIEYLEKLKKGFTGTHRG